MRLIHKIELAHNAQIFLIGLIFGLAGDAQAGMATNKTLEQLIFEFQDKKNQARDDLIREIGKMGENAKPAVPQLIEALKDPDKWVRSAAADTLGKIGTNAQSAVPQLAAALKDPHELTRNNAAWALSKMGKSAETAVPQLIESFKNQGNMAAARTLAELGIASIIPILKAAPAIDDLCKSFCGLVDTARNGVLKTLAPDSSAHMVPHSNQVALDRLDALFVIKSTPLCPSPENKTFVEQSLNRYLQSNLPGAAEKLARMEDFSSLKIYGSQFQMQILKELIARKDDFKLNQTNLKKLYEAFQNEAVVASQQFGKHSGIGGSAMITYAQASHLIHLKAGTSFDNTPTSDALAELKKAVESDPIKLPYQLSSGPPDSSKASAARAIPANLAMYLIESATTSKVRNAQSLYRALKNYNQHVGVLVAHTIFYPDTHNRDQEGIAPYYFYSTIPYAMTALQILQSEQSLTKEQKDELSLISDRLNVLLLGLLNQDKAQMIGQSPFLKENGIFRSSPRYVTALGELALIPLLSKKCGDKKDSFGVLSDVDVRGIDQFFTPDVRDSGKPAGH